jgi:predicted CXXCH cytochrome family protein
MIAPALALSLLAAAAPVPPELAAWPEPLRPFLTAKDKEGKPALSPEQRAALEKLPEHTRKLLATAADNQILGSAQHLGVLLSLDLSPQALEIVAQDNCILCHSDPGNQKAQNLFALDPGARKSNALLNLKDFVSDVHFRRGLSCAGCHGGTPKDESMVKEIGERWPRDRAERHKDRSWIPAFCAKCHADPAFMRGFNPGLPTDQLAKYKESQHGLVLLEKKDSRAAQCVSCHGVHGIRGPKSRKSSVHPQRIPETCGSCHADAKLMAGFTDSKGQPLPTNQLEQYKQSVHGKALLEKGDLGAPACNGCHGNHAAMPPAVASVAQVCRSCHTQNGALFDGSRHKKAFEERKWPECEQCHGRHGIQKPSDAMLGSAKGTLCQDCHAQFAKDNQSCSTTADHFRATLASLAAGQKILAPEVEHLAERGLDVEPLSTSLSELGEALVQARTKVHAFDRSSFDAAAAPGKEALDKSHKLVAEARAEHRFRRAGLFTAIGFLGLLAAGLWMKIRTLDKSRQGP